MKKKKFITQRKYEILNGWLFFTPALILLSFFLFGPFIFSIIYSFTDQRLISPLPTSFIGFTNFLRLFSDNVFYKSIFNNIKFALMVVPVQTSLALFMAILVNRSRIHAKLFRLIYFMPVVVTMVVVSVIWYFMYNPTIGIINTFLNFITCGTSGIIKWLENEYLALTSIAILSIWQGVGFQMVIFLAGLQEIPTTLYDAAYIDGASSWQTFWHVTLAQLKNTIVFVVISTTILSFQLFSQVKIMTNGGPNNATSTMVLYIYNAGFKNLKVGYASAASLIFVIIVLIISFVQRIFLKSEKEIE
jgi:multiple sugar transport system permease protein